MSRHPIEFKMSREDQKAVREILRAGIQQVRVVLRAIALEQLTAGQTAPGVARIVHLSPQGGPADRSSLSEGRPEGCFVRAAGARFPGVAGCLRKAARHRDGL